MAGATTSDARTATAFVVSTRNAARAGGDTVSASAATLAGPGLVDRRDRGSARRAPRSQAAQQGSRAAGEALRGAGEAAAEAAQSGSEAGAAAVRRTGDAVGETLRRNAEAFAES